MQRPFDIIVTGEQIPYILMSKENQDSENMVQNKEKSKLRVPK